MFLSFFLPFPPYHFPCLPCCLLSSFPSLPLSLSSNLFASLLSSFLFCILFYLQDFSHVCPSFDLQRVNSLELSMLEALKYLIKVSAGVFSCPCACLHTFVVWSVMSEMLSVKCEMLSLMSEMLCLKCEIWSLICEICMITNATSTILAASIFLFTFCGFVDWKFFDCPYFGISVAFIYCIETSFTTWIRKF